MNNSNKNDIPYGIIVDGYSSGSELVKEFKNLGVLCVHVQSQKLIPDVYVKTFNPSLYANHFIFDDGLTLLCQGLQSYNPIFCVAGSEPGVELADMIADQLNLPNANPKDSSKLRRDKYWMHERLKELGLANIPQFCSSNLPKLLAWGQEHLKDYPVVIKPRSSAGGDRVKICHSEQDIIDGYNQIMSGEPNMLGLVDTDVLLQQFISSPYPEIAINSVQYAGNFHLCEIWEFHKTIHHDCKIYDYADLKPVNSYPPPLLSYAKDVAQALEINYGPMHAEVFMTQDGPILIEAAARLMGANIPAELVAECMTTPQLLMTCLSYSDPKQFLELAKTQNIIKKHIRVVFLVSTKSGKFVRINHLERLKKLPSFFDIKIRLQDKIHITKDYDSSPGLIYLRHEDHSTIEKDFRTIRGLEARDLYETQ